MGLPSGLWSYVHEDDHKDGGRITRLANDVADEYETQTGERIELFLDIDAVEWGERWRGKIDQALATIAFFIPVLTPRYFMSVECRRELQSFARRAKDLGVSELVLPLLYVDVDALHEEDPSDDLVALVKDFQWMDWTEVRYEEVSSSTYRRGVAELAKRLIRANRQADQGDVAAALAREEESPGILDRLAAMEEALAPWSESLDALTVGLETMTQVITEGAAEMEAGDARGKGFSARLVAARKMAQELQAPAETVWAAGNSFASQLHAVDEGIRIIIERAPMEVGENPEALRDTCEFFRSIRDLSEKTHEGLGEVKILVDAMEPLEGVSRDLRPPLKRLRQGFTLTLEGLEVAEEWVRMMDEAGMDRDDTGGGASTG